MTNHACPTNGNIIRLCAKVSKQKDRLLLVRIIGRPCMESIFESINVQQAENNRAGPPERVHSVLRFPFESPRWAVRYELLSGTAGGPSSDIVGCLRRASKSYLIELGEVSDHGR